MSDCRRVEAELYRFDASYSTSIGVVAGWTVGSHDDGSLAKVIDERSFGSKVGGPREIS